MDEFIYNLFLRSRGGVTLFGQLRYRLTGIEVGAVPDANVFSLPGQRQKRQSPTQQQPSILTVVYRADGSVTVPLLTGLQPVPVGDVAFFIQMGPPLLTRLASVGSRILIAFNQINNQQIGGHLLWAPTNTTFGLLGRRVILPA
jgi:hypothetical protein